MGIDGLWKILEPGSEKYSFKEYTLARSLRPQNGDKGSKLRPIIVGIDASIWMNESQAVFGHRHHAQMGESPELRALFYRLAHLLEICAVPVFVFDGPLRPSKKRGKRVITQPHWLTQRFKELIKVFGFYSHIAPGEAEAELALLNRLGVLDAIMTEDSDAFVFGATCVIRKSEDKARSDQVRIYSAEKIQSRLGMQQNDLIFMAVLCGGDYDKAGLVGCGTAIASQLVNLHMGDVLYKATFLPQAEMSASLETCRFRLRDELTTNTSGYLRRRHSQLATKIDESFPSIDTLRRYTSPSVSNLKFLDTVAWVPQIPNIGGMFRICEELFSWGTADGILKKFKSVVWTGVCSQQLVQFQCDNDFDVIVIPKPSFLSAEKPARSRKNSALECYDVKVKIDSVIMSNLDFLRYSRKLKSAIDKPLLIETYSTFTARIPSIVVQHALPNLPKPSAKKNKSTKGIDYPHLETEHEVIDLT